MRNVTDFITSPKDGKIKFDLNKEYTVLLFTESHGYRMKNYGAVQLTKFNGSFLIDHQIKPSNQDLKNLKLFCAAGLNLVGYGNI